MKTTTNMNNFVEQYKNYQPEDALKKLLGILWDVDPSNVYIIRRGDCEHKLAEIGAQYGNGGFCCFSTDLDSLAMFQAVELFLLDWFIDFEDGVNFKLEAAERVREVLQKM
jgi:hypothetical protein